MGKKIKLDPFLTHTKMTDQMYQRIKWKTNELMNKQINNSVKVLEEAWVNLLKTWEWKIFPIYTNKAEVIREKRKNFATKTNKQPLKPFYLAKKKKKGN